MRKWPLLVLISATIFFGDLVSKFLAVEHLTSAFRIAQAHTLGEKIAAFISQKDLRGITTGSFDVFRSWLQLRYTENPGAAFSFLAGMHGPWRTLFFHLITIGALIFIFVTYRRLNDSQRWMQVSFSLLLGGALGNGLDRFIHGYVIDFIACHVNDPEWTGSQWLHWPTFNIADCGVSVGLVMLVLAMMFQKDPAKSEKPAGSSSARREAIAKPPR